MTAPTEPTPGAPVQASETPAAAPGAPTPANMPQNRPTPGPTGPDPGEHVDVASLPANVQHLIATIRADAAKDRTNKSAAAETARREVASQVAKALGLQTDGPPDPAVLTQHLEAARDAAWRTSVELNVYRTAGNADVAAKLLDSRAFIGTLEDLVDLDPESEEFRTELQAKVQEAAAKYPPGQASGPRPDPSQGTRGTGPTVDSRIAEARSKGDWRTVISLENQKLQQL